MYLGYIGWSAGSFARNYILNLSPAGSADVPLVTKCFISKSGKPRNPPQLPPAPLNRPPTPLDGPPAPANPARKFKAQIKGTPTTLATAVKPTEDVKPFKAVKPSPAVKQPRASPSPTLEENGDDVGAVKVSPAVKPFKAVKPSPAVKLSPDSSSSTLEENEDDVAVKSSTAVKPSPASSSPTLEENRDDFRAVKPSPAPSSPTLEDNGDNVGCDAKLWEKDEHVLWIVDSLHPWQIWLYYLSTSCCTYLPVCRYSPSPIYLEIHESQGIPMASPSIERMRLCSILIDQSIVCACSLDHRLISINYSRLCFKVGYVVICLTMYLSSPKGISSRLTSGPGFWRLVRQVLMPSILPWISSVLLENTSYRFLDFPSLLLLRNIIQ